MSAVTFTLTNAVGLWSPDASYAYTTYAATTLQFQFKDAAGTVLQTCPVTAAAAVTSNSLSLPCTMIVQIMGDDGTAGTTICTQDFAYGGPGASAGDIPYPSPLFRAIVTSIGMPSLTTTPTMAVTCTGAGYFSSAGSLPKPSYTYCLVIFSMTKFAADKRFAVAIDNIGTAAAAVSPNAFAPFVGSSFVLSAGTPTYQYMYPAASYSLSTSTNVRFTLSSDECYKASFFMLSEGFLNAPIENDAGAICGTLSFQAKTSNVLRVDLTGL